jgi:hypothetical protein
MDFLTISFIIVLVVPAILLVARMRQDIGRQHAEGERMRVQRQRNAVMRRRLDERRSKVWSEIDSAHLKFREREQIIAHDPPSTTPKEIAHNSVHLHEDLNT